MLFMCMGLLRRKYLPKCCIFLILRLREFTWFHNWWLAKSWTPIVEQLFHNWSISLISSCPLWNKSLFWWIKGIYIVPQLVIGQILDSYCGTAWSNWVWQVFHNWGLNVPQMGGGKTVPKWDLTFFLFSDRNKFFSILWDD